MDLQVCTTVRGDFSILMIWKLSVKKEESKDCSDCLVPVASGEKQLDTRNVLAFFFKGTKQ